MREVKAETVDELMNWLAGGSLPEIAWTFSAHAIERYRERTGCKRSDDTIRNRLAVKLQSRKHIGGDKWYCRGWVFAIVDNKVITVMRPREYYMQEKVWNGVNGKSRKASPQIP